MKKLTVLLMVFIMLFSMAACSEKQDPVSNDSGESSGQSDRNSNTQGSQTSDKDLQQISFEGLSMYVDASYGVHKRITEDGIYCGQEMDGYTNVAVEIASFGRDSGAYLMGSSEELANICLNNPEYETLGERNGVHYVKHEEEGFGYVEAFYSVEDR